MRVLCNYCGDDAEYVDSIEVYQSSHGMIYLCRHCEAWVGVHKGTETPLGRLANKELRRAKQAAHRVFDRLWRRVMNRDNIAKHHARGRAYKWLARELGIKTINCHIGMFNIEQCEQVVDICNHIGTRLTLRNRSHRPRLNREPYPLPRRRSNPASGQSATSSCPEFPT